MTAAGPDGPDLARYSRQMAFAPLGRAGQRRLAEGRVTLVGCGALGTVAAGVLVRAGVGHVRLIDRDFVELVNLQRQTLFDEQDAALGLPKAEAAARRLRRVNSTVTVEPLIADVHAGNVAHLCRDTHVIVDATDNFETRYLLNDLAVRQELPWVYGACLGSEGRVLAVRPGVTPCLRCLFEEAPPPGTSPTCESAGVLGPAVGVVANLQAMAALKLLTGHEDAVAAELLTIDVWSNRWHAVDVRAARRADCPCCGLRRFEFLEGTRVAPTTVMCGREAVQVSPSVAAKLDLSAVAARLGLEAAPALNRFLLRFRAGECTITLFPDGRAIVQGTSDAATARALYARYVVN